MGLRAEIWALRLGLSLERGGLTEEKEKKKKKKKNEEKFPLCLKASVIGPFGAAAQKVVPLGEAGKVIAFFLLNNRK